MGKQILLCDDEIHILRAAEFKVKRAGYEVRIAGDGEEGWELIQEQLPDLVVTDCQMPRLDGLGLIARAREHEATRELPFFMLTAKGLELSHAELAEKLNVLGVISKPFSPRDLLRSIDEVLKPAAAIG
jgi:two-component system, OmpR family, alkaline phosphatase synthesis response regulator PhoP